MCPSYLVYLPRSRRHTLLVCRTTTLRTLCATGRDEVYGVSTEIGTARTATIRKSPVQFTWQACLKGIRLLAAQSSISSLRRFRRVSSFLALTIHQVAVRLVRRRLGLEELPGRGVPRKHAGIRLYQSRRSVLVRIDAGLIGFFRFECGLTGGCHSTLVDELAGAAC